MKKGWIIGCSIAGVLVLGCAGVIVAIVMTAVGAIASFAKPADEFLAQLGSGNTAGAYQSGASGLRTAQTQEEFAASVKAMRLDQYKSSSWNKFNVVNNTGTLEGTVTLTDGSTVPLTVDLVNEGGWKVLGMKTTAGGVADPGGVRAVVPPEAELKKLVSRDMIAFHRAVKADDFGAFHDTLSKQLRAEKSAAELREAFKEFVEKKIDFSPVEKVDPTLSKPATVGGDGVLEVVGEYPSRPATVLFTLRYVSQDGGWKLLGINVRTKAAE